MVEYPQGKTPKLMAHREYRRLLGNSKGGQVAAQRKTAHRWTPETARKAAQKLWRTRYRVNKHIGVRLGMVLAKRPPVFRAPLRARYALGPDTNPAGIWYDPFNRQWVRAGTVLSERQALRQLGHLPGPNKQVPRRIITRIDLVKGKTVATKVDHD